MGKGFVKRVTLEQATTYFQKPVFSSQAKSRRDGEKAGDSRCPAVRRQSDGHMPRKDRASALRRHPLNAGRHEGPGDRAQGLLSPQSMPLVDAFTHFPVAEQELAQCISPEGDGHHAYVFVALFFGHKFKTAPLLMCRLSALLARLLQGCFWTAEVTLGCYVDDPLFALVGARHRRQRNLSFILLTLAALGIVIAYHKGDLGAALTWIGVDFELTWFPGTLRADPGQELLQALRGWSTKGLVPVSELRTIAGKVTWAAGIYPQAPCCAR